jgi:molybdenum cofactor biosynthesis enzyme MoaA
MRLEDIGFYTLSDERAKKASGTSPMWRGELLVTGECNFSCNYCRGPCAGLEEPSTFNRAAETVDLWTKDGLKNLRISGGEPTLWEMLCGLVIRARISGVERVAISTNGSAERSEYERLIDAGVNDFSISLDACCASQGDSISGVSGSWEKIVENTSWLSDRAYVTVGVVLTEENIGEMLDIVRFAHELGVADIRIISAAQDNRLLTDSLEIEKEILDSHPVLKYRARNIAVGRNVRGLRPMDPNRCYLVQDDSAVAGGYHYPCIIYLREGGAPIGKVSENMREERVRWSLSHNTKLDSICKANCLDVCIDYNTRWEEFNV